MVQVLLRFTIMDKSQKGNQVLPSNAGVYMSKLSHNEVLDKIKFGLIASCQPVDDGPMDKPEIVAAMAQASVVGGAAGLRIEGIENLKATRPTVECTDYWYCEARFTLIAQCELPHFARY